MAVDELDEARPPVILAQWLSAQAILSGGSSSREGTSTGRNPASRARSAVRAAWLAERTEAKVPTASTRVAPAVAIEEIVAQSVMATEPRGSLGPCRRPRRTTSPPVRRASDGAPRPGRGSWSPPPPGAVVAVVAGAFGLWELAPLLGWDTAALTYLAWTYATVSHLDSEHTARQAVAEDPGRAATDVLLLSASVASLVAVCLVIVRAGGSSGAVESLQAGLGLASVVLSWAVVHTIFTLRYASLYYGGPDGGVDFNQDDPPRYADFAYLAFTIGMTFQVSDTDLKTTEIRATALRHALLSYLSRVGDPGRHHQSHRRAGPLGEEAVTTSSDGHRPGVPSTPGSTGRPRSPAG